MTTVDAAAISDRPTIFSLVGAPLLASGQSMDLLARSPHLWVHSKIYAEGGENGLHSHSIEDHLFLVLTGEACFRDLDGKTTVVGPYGGILIPAGNVYAFESTGAENLVMLRVGTSSDHQKSMETVSFGDQQLPGPTAVRRNHDGTESAPGDRRNGRISETPQVASGEFFAT